MSEKNEEPTDKKLEDARKSGQVPVSKDLAKLATLTAIGELAFLAEGFWRESVQAMMNLAFSRVDQPFPSALLEMSGAGETLLITVFLTLLLTCSIVGVASYWGQFGVLIATESMKLNFDRLNPANGVKQLFSKKKLGEIAMMLLKTAIIGLVIYSAIHDALPTIVRLSGGLPKDIYFGFIAILHSIFRTITGVCLCFALVDFGLQKHFHTKSLNMSLDDIKREYRESEGDPMVKGMRQHLARELASSGPVAKTGEADAVVVNPTHFAVALLYDVNLAPVPLVLAKGRDETAQAMIAYARERGIPVIRHVWLARSLYATGRQDMAIPKASYQAVAHVYAVVEELRHSDQRGREPELERYGEMPENG